LGHGDTTLNARRPVNLSLVIVGENIAMALYRPDRERYRLWLMTQPHRPRNDPSRLCDTLRCADRHHADQNERK